MPIQKVDYNNINITPSASQAIKFNSSANAFETGGLGSFILIQSQTASSSSSISFTTGIDSTYNVYCFKFINIHPSTQSAFEFNGSTDGGSNYNVSKTTTSYRSAHNEDDGRASINYETTYDLANGTGYQSLDQENLPTDNTSAENGYLLLYNPSSTTFAKHFISSTVEGTPWFNNNFVHGYFNTTSAVNAIDFKMGSGTIDSGVIKLYGIK